MLPIAEELWIREGEDGEDSNYVCCGQNITGAVDTADAEKHLGSSVWKFGPSSEYFQNWETLGFRRTS